MYRAGLPKYDTGVVLNWTSLSNFMLSDEELKGHLLSEDTHTRHGLTLICVFLGRSAPQSVLKAASDKKHCPRPKCDVS